MTTLYIAQSARGRPVSTFDDAGKAREFMDRKRAQGVRLMLVKETVTREVVAHA